MIHARLSAARVAFVGLAVALPHSLAHAQSVAEIWENNCLSCHGKDGRGGGAGTPSLLDNEWSFGGSDRELFDSIKTGHPDAGMEAFGESLTDPQIWGLVVYLHEQRERARRREVGDPTPRNGVFTSSHATFALEDVASGDLDVPWGIDFLPAGPRSAPTGWRTLVTNRPGTIAVFDGLGPKAAALGEVQGLPRVRNVGQGGLMDVAVHPDAGEDGWVYLAYAEPRGGDGGRSVGTTKVVRGKIVRDGKNWNWTQQQTIFEAPEADYFPGPLHFGVRLVFGPTIKEGPDAGKRHLFFGIGDRGRMNDAQDLARSNGKIHRLFDDGTIPADNPFASAADRAADRLASIWSYGHRNPQGLVLALDGHLYDTEHGPRGGDELNRIAPGKDFGWPTVSFGINYNNTPFRTPWGPESIVMPLHHWTPSIGVSGLDVVQAGAAGEAFPAWRGDLVAGGLSGQNVDRVRIVDGKVAEVETLIRGQGRVRDVVVGPDGAVYVALNDPNKIVRLVPPSSSGGTR